MGSTPYHYWTAGGNKTRETEPCGEGWELFVNYLTAKEKFDPDFFIFESSNSISDKIKQQITKELKCESIMIDSALVSAQSRKRLYWYNISGVELPEHTNEYVKDIIKSTVSHDDTTYLLRHKFDDPSKRSILRPIRIGDIKTKWEDHRVYSTYGKSVTLKATGGKQGAKTGLYLCPVDIGASKCDNIHYVANKKLYANDDIFEIGGIPDGQYIIRRLAVSECCRLQTLPIDYCKGIDPYVAYMCLGDAWTAEVIIHILKHAHIPEDEEIVVLSMYDGIGVGRYCLDKMGYANVTYHSYEINEDAIGIANKNYRNIFQCGNAFKIRDDDWRLKKTRWRKKPIDKTRMPARNA